MGRRGSILDDPHFFWFVQAYLITELLEGGQLLDALLARPQHHYTEADARIVVKQVLAGLAYLHER